MRWVDTLRMRFAMLFRRGSASAELERELQFHLDAQIAENLAAGMDAAQARTAALRFFGNPTAIRDDARESWHWRRLEVLSLDIRQSFRALRRSPSFSIVAILVLALGIGANVALFSVVHFVLLKSLPFVDPDRLVRVYEADARGRFRDNVVAGGTYTSWKTQSKSFEDLALKSEAGYNLSGAGSTLPEFVMGEYTSWNLFPTLGIRPALGRLFLADDDRPAASATVVLSWGLWKRRYAGDPSILGKSILLDARPFTVIGVLPAWFTYPDAKVQLWTPLFHEKSQEMMVRHDAHNFDVVGRLKPGVSMAQANAELNTIQMQIRKQYPDGPVMDAASMRPILDAEVHDVKLGLYALLAATGCLLLIACLNIANLLIARAAARSRETAIRTALGGTRFRLIRGQVIESLLLSFAGGAIGVGLAYGALQWLVATRIDIPRADSIHVDGMALLFALAIVVVCGLIAGVVPAVSMRDLHLVQALQESSRSHSGGEGRVRVRKLLLTVEVALTVVLLVGAGLLLRSYQQLRTVDLGCAVRNVLTMDLVLPKGSYTNATKRVNFFEELAKRAAALPGVQAAALTSGLPGNGHGQDDIYSIVEHPALPQGQFLDASTFFVDPGYFSAMQIPLISGRFLLPGERFERANAVVISQALAREVFPNEDPIGRHIASGVNGDRPPYEIVGVVGDIREDIAAPVRAAIYFPLYMGSERKVTLVLRTATKPEEFSTPVQGIIARLDHDLPVAYVFTMDQVVGEATFQASFDAVLLFSFAIVSLLLAAVGLFGVLSFIVNQRTAEIGIRIALGADRSQVARLMLIDGLRPAVFGMSIGLVASAGITRFIASILFGTRPLDPLVYFTVMVTLLVVSAAACAIPAWRASHLEPMQALRSE